MDVTRIVLQLTVGQPVPPGVEHLSFILCVRVCDSFRAQNRNHLNGKCLGKGQNALVVHVSHSNVLILRQAVGRL